MKIKILWGFIGDADKLKSDSRQIKRGQVFDNVEDEYAHHLIGAKLAEEVDGDESTAGGDKVDKAELLARAKELGIDAKGTWGVTKLQEAIAEAEKKADEAPPPTTPAGPTLTAPDEQKPAAPDETK